MPTITRGLAAHPPPVPDGQSKTRVFCEGTRGFIMEVRPTGAVSFYVRYRDVRGRQREIRLGRLGEVTVDQARKRAIELKAAASLGGDPAAERDRLRAVPTFAEFVEQRYLPFARERLRSFRDQESFYRLRLQAMWGRRRLDELTPHDVVEMQDSLRREGLSNAKVNRYTAFVRRAFNLASRWQIVDLPRNPAQHAEMRREHHRELFLSQAELRALFRALDEEPNRLAAGMIALLAATGARKGEAMGARWEHIDLDQRLWVVPVSKSGRRRHIPLSDAAVQIIASLPRDGTSSWLFPSRVPDQPIRCVKKAFERIKKRAGLRQEIRVHDIRHSFASTLIQRGSSIHIVSTLLGHSNLSMTMRYAHLAPAQLIDAANQALPDFT